MLTSFSTAGPKEVVDTKIASYVTGDMVKPGPNIEIPATVEQKKISRLHSLTTQNQIPRHTRTTVAVFHHIARGHQKAVLIDSIALKDMDGVIALRMHDFDRQTNKSFPVRQQQPSLSKKNQGSFLRWTPAGRQPLLFPRRSSMSNTNNMNRGGVGVRRTPVKDSSRPSGMSVKFHSPIKSKTKGNWGSPTSCTTEGKVLQPLAPASADKKDSPFANASDPERDVPGPNKLYASGRAGTESACRAEKGATVLPAVGAASQHLRIALSPAGSPVGTTVTGKREGFSKPEDSKIHAKVPPAAGGEEDDSLALQVRSTVSIFVRYSTGLRASCRGVVVRLKMLFYPSCCWLQSFGVLFRSCRLVFLAFFTCE